ncbi:MAG TPA: hypothetical protein VIU11_09095 [Nakamurella sp.]
MTISPTTGRIIGRIAWISAFVATVLGVLHALARHATASGQSDLDSPLTSAWAVPAAEALRPLLTWSDPDTVYLSYGKLWAPIVIAFTLCAFVAYSRRRPAGFEKWVWRSMITGYVLVSIAVQGYYTPWLDLFFVFLMVPGLLLTLVASSVLGILLLRRHVRPTSTAWLLTVSFPLLFVIPLFTSLGNVLLPLIWAWAIAGRRISRGRLMGATVAPTEVHSRVGR